MRHAAPSTLPGLASRTLSPTCPTLCMWLRCFASGHARGPFQPGVGLPRRSRGSPGDLGTVEWGNAVHVHEPSGISVRILVEGSPGAHRRTRREGRTYRTCGRVDTWGSEPHDDGNQHASSFELLTPAPKAGRHSVLSVLLQTRCPQRTVPAPATISGALPSSSCNFAGVSQR